MYAELAEDTDAPALDELDELLLHESDAESESDEEELEGLEIDDGAEKPDQTPRDVDAQLAAMEANLAALNEKVSYQTPQRQLTSSWLSRNTRCRRQRTAAPCPAGSTLRNGRRRRSACGCRYILVGDHNACDWHERIGEVSACDTWTPDPMTREGRCRNALQTPERWVLLRPPPVWHARWSYCRCGCEQNAAGSKREAMGMHRKPEACLLLDRPLK